MTGSAFLTEEVSNSKVAAIFSSPAQAQLQADRVRTALGLAGSQVQVLTPKDHRPGSKLEPESHGIFRTMLWAHAKLGAIGAVVGVIAYLVMRMLAIPMIVNSPGLSFGVLLAFGAVAGLFLGGLVTLRPDHDPYVFKVLGALREGDSAVIVHAFSTEQRDQARQMLETAGGETVATL